MPPHLFCNKNHKLFKYLPNCIFAAMHFTAITFWQKIVQWDHSLFKKINSDWTNSLFDTIMPFLRKSTHWIPLYLFLLVFVLLNFRTKAIWWIVFFIVSVALSDITGTYLFKHGFERVRPCNNPDILSHLRLLVVCPSGYGFTSNHAANHFAMATFIFITFRHLFKSWTLLAFAWAGAIAYAQVYVGVHYPGDVVCGAFLGIIFGTFTGTQFNKHIGYLLSTTKPN